MDKFCRNCGTPRAEGEPVCSCCQTVFDDAPEAQSSVRTPPINITVVQPQPEQKSKPKYVHRGWAVWRLVSGILSIIFSVSGYFTSCTAYTMVNLLQGMSMDGEAPSTALATSGLIVGAAAVAALLLLAGGIVSIATRELTMNGTIATTWIFYIAAGLFLCGLSAFSFYTSWCLACAIASHVSMSKAKYVFCQ